jgi:small-conductance mechanosensitive channel/CRP-like cAMP-binding protein
MPRFRLTSLFFPSVIFAALLIVQSDWIAYAFWLGWKPDAAASLHISRLLEAFCWIGFGFLFTRACRVFFWHGILSVAGIHVPGMLLTFAAVINGLVIVGIIIAKVYDQSMTALLTTSTVLIGVAGIALQKLISDFFSGMVLGLETPYALGDWLQVEPGGMTGKVVEFNWRSTRILTQERTTIVIPNSHLVGNPFRNISNPEKYFRDELRIPLAFEVTSYQAQRILLSAANQVDDIAAAPRKPSVSILEYDERGVIWQLFYWIPDRARRNRLRFAVHQNILRNLHFAGLQIAMPVRESQRAPVTDPLHSGVFQLLKQSKLFGDLHNDELEILASGATERIYYADEPMLNQGNPGSSLFIVNEGILAVRIADGKGGESQVARILPGEFFGELSLLTGAPRGATVVPITDCRVTEIGKDVMKQILSKRLELAEMLSRILAERQAVNEQQLGSQDGAQRGASTDGIARQFLGKISAFFNL